MDLISQEIKVGEPVEIEHNSPLKNIGVVFEDDGETGYFYALDYARDDNPIVDALHIYNVADITDGHIPSVVKLGWSKDSLKAVLVINNYPHAIFDFESRNGYCRTGFPPPAPGDWGAAGHVWNDNALNLFR